MRSPTEVRPLRYSVSTEVPMSGTGRAQPPQVQHRDDGPAEVEHAQHVGRCLRDARDGCPAANLADGKDIHRVFLVAEVDGEILRGLFGRVDGGIGCLVHVVPTADRIGGSGPLPLGYRLSPAELEGQFQRDVRGCGSGRPGRACMGRARRTGGHRNGAYGTAGCRSARVRATCFGAVSPDLARQLGGDREKMSRASARSYIWTCTAGGSAPRRGRQAALRRAWRRTRPATSAIRATEPSARMVAPEMPLTRR